MSREYRAVRLFIALLVAITLVPMGIASADTRSQLSPPGGIGNTRSDFETSWGVTREFGDPFIAYQQDYRNLETRDSNITLMVMYLVESDLQPRPSDRVAWFMVNLMAPVTVASARQSIQDFLPEDAILDRESKNRFGEPRDIYMSISAQEQFPTLLIDEEVIQGTGEIFVTYGNMGLGGRNVVAIEVGLYDDYDE